jgi:transposase
LFIAQAINVSGRTVFKKESQMDALDPVSQIVARHLYDQIQHLEDSRLEYVKIFKGNLANGQIKALATIPGVSAIRANMIAATVCDAKRFASKNKFWSYCNLVKRDKQSDGHSYGKESGPGNLTLKGIFVGAAQTVINKNCKMKKYYDLQRVKGHDERTSKRNLARKIAAIALSLMKTGQAYKENLIVNDVI